MKVTVDYLFYPFTIWLSFHCSECTLNYQIVLERIEPIRGTPENLIDYSRLKISRNGVNYTFNGNFTHFVDMDDDFLGEITTAHSSLGSSQFISQPYTVPKTPMCTFFKTAHKKYIEPTFLGHTDFPVIPPEGLCPIPKGAYYSRGATFNYRNFPTHMLKGLWRVEERFYKGNDCIGGLRFFFKVV